LRKRRHEWEGDALGAAHLDKGFWVTKHHTLKAELDDIFGTRELLLVQLIAVPWWGLAGREISSSSSSSMFIQAVAAVEWSKVDPCRDALLQG
jgi:hypothetical protein